MQDLLNLPSRGTFLSANAGVVICQRPEQYVCTHNTAPPSNQIIINDPNESLAAWYKKGQPCGKDAAKGKRPGPTPASGETPAAKKQHTVGPPVVGSSTPQGTSALVHFSQEELKAKTVRELTEILKARGLPTSGKKDELIRRVVDYQRKQKRAGAHP